MPGLKVPIRESWSAGKPASSWIWSSCNTRAKLAATPARRHHLPHQPGRQWHSPAEAWQPSAWTQSHLFTQPGPNVPICTCEQMPTGEESSGGISSKCGQLTRSQTKYYSDRVLTRRTQEWPSSKSRWLKRMETVRGGTESWTTLPQSNHICSELHNYCSYDLCISVINKSSFARWAWHRGNTLHIFPISCA